MKAESLSFAAIENYIRTMPDGPYAVFTTPRWLVWLSLLGTVGIILGTLPSVMIHFLTPDDWMVVMARLGLGMAILGYAPAFVRSIWVLAFEFWHWQPKLVEQSDHDLVQFRELRLWLWTFPRVDLEEHHRFARLSQARLTAKIGFLQGGFDKLGVLPAMAALLLLLANSGEISADTMLDVPLWRSGLALVFAITYFVAMLAVLMRLRLQLYEAILSNALEFRASESAVTESGDPFSNGRA